MFGFFHFQNLVGIAATIFCNQTLIKKSLNVFFSIARNNMDTRDGLDDSSQL